MVYVTSMVQFSGRGLMRAVENVRKRFDRLGWKTERKVTPLILVYGKRERRGKERSGEGGEGDGRGEMERSGEGLRCESAHTGNFIEGNKHALRTEV